MVVSRNNDIFLSPRSLSSTSSKILYDIAWDEICDCWRVAMYLPLRGVTNMLTPLERCMLFITLSFFHGGLEEKCILNTFQVKLWKMYTIMVLFFCLVTKCIHHFSRQIYLAIFFLCCQAIYKYKSTVTAKILKTVMLKWKRKKKSRINLCPEEVDGIMHVCILEKLMIMFGKTLRVA